MMGTSIYKILLIHESSYSREYSIMYTYLLCVQVLHRMRIYHFLPRNTEVDLFSMAVCWPLHRHHSLQHPSKGWPASQTRQWTTVHSPHPLCLHPLHSPSSLSKTRERGNTALGLSVAWSVGVRHIALRSACTGVQGFSTNSAYTCVMYNYSQLLLWFDSQSSAVYLCSDTCTGINNSLCCV